MKKKYLWCLLNIKTKKLIKGLLFDEARAVVLALSSEDYKYWSVWREGWDHWKPLDYVDGLNEDFARNLTEEMPPFSRSTKNANSHKDKFKIEDFSFNDNSSLDLERTEKKMKNNSKNNKSRKSNFKNSGSGYREKTFHELLNSDDKSLKKNIIQINEDSNHIFFEREFKRYNKKFEVLIIQNGQIFKTHTIDISVGGLLLNDPLPASVAGYFKVKIRHPANGQQVELTCCLAENQDPNGRYRVAFLPLKNSEDHDALEEWIKAA